jgi:AcrR family transcriptional regulator
MSALRTMRRTEAKAPLVRGEPVVRGVLSAAMEELGRTGYAALRVEDVAARAGVNKTTIYRRWPTKEDLVRAALLSITGERFAAPNTGSLRTDLIEVARAAVSMFRSLEGQGLMRVCAAEGPDSELMVIARSLKNNYEAIPRSVIEAAEARGELAPGIDAMLLFDVLMGALQKRMMMDRDDVDEAFLGRLLDLLLHGALAREPRDREATRAKAAPPSAAGRRHATR